MLAFGIQVRRIIRGNSGGGLSIRQGYEPNSLARRDVMLFDRESRPCTRRAAGVATVILVRAASAHVIVSDEPGFNTVQEGLEVEEAGGDDAERLDDLCA